MSDETPLLSLPLILPAQAQKHVTHNEALRLLDVLVQLAVTDRTRTTPPPAPAEGDRHLVAAGASGDWAGRAGQIAAFWGGAWLFLPPRAGWTLHVIDENVSLVHAGGVWAPVGGDGPEQLDRLGIATPADAVNRLAVAAPATLLTHDGAGHQVKVNKATAAETASLLFQTGFSGRAEIGTLGNDALALKVSPDGQAFVTALRAPASGRVEMPQGATVSGLLDGSAVTQSQTDGTPGRLLKNHDHGLGARSGTEVARITNLDDPDLRTGFFATGAGTTGTFPVGAGTLGCGLMTRADSTGFVMIYADAGSDAVWMRRFAGSAFGPWRRLLSPNALLGPVSQSGGVPTGAVIERLAASNGATVRFADGTQICSHSVTSSTTATTTWNFPSAFAALPAVTAAPTATVCAGVGISGISTGAVAFNIWSTANARLGLTVSLMAVGRWF